MSDLINSTESAVINHLLGKSQWSFDSSIYAALFTAAPADDGSGGTEVSAGGYARQQITGDMSSSSSGSNSSNQSIIRFGPATEDWGTIVGVGIYTDSSGGTLRAYSGLDANVTINDGNAFEFDVGNLVVSAE